MKHILLALVLTAAAVSAQSGRTLPPDIDARSYSRLPLISKDSLGVEGRRVFEAINGQDATVPRLGPPANSMYALAASEPYDRLNQLLRTTRWVRSSSRSARSCRLESSTSSTNGARTRWAPGAPAWRTP